MKQRLELKQAPRLSPLQIQTIKLVELPILDLEQKIRSELESNPVLDDTPNPDPNKDENTKDISIDEIKAKGDDDIPAYRLNVNNWGKDARPEYNTFSVKESFVQNLTDQLGCRDLDETDYKIALYIIGSLDPAGYLRRDIDSIVDDLAFRVGIETKREKVLEMLAVVQELEPVGIGARDLQECLLLQLKSKKRSPEIEIAIKILDKCFVEFTNKHYSKIMRKLNISEDELKRSTKKILKLNPRPGGGGDDAFSDKAQVKVPDFIITSEGGDLSFIMTRFNVPELRINKTYMEMINNHPDTREQKDTISFIKKKYEDAKYFVEALKQRQNTLNITMRAILDYQKDFFETGDESLLKPMVLKDIAKVTGLDISTISRVVNSKCVETYYGIYDLKYFFSEGLETEDGDEVSTREIKNALLKIIEAESKKNPLTDEQLTAKLKAQGYLVARRTIAKYRGQLNIPLARLRKEL